MNTRIFCYGKTAFKKFLIPTSCSAAAAAAAAAVSSSPDKKETNEPSKLVRPSELPIYPEEETPSPPKCDPSLSSDSVLYSSVQTVRKCIWTLIDEGKILGQQAFDYIETGKAHTASTLAFLRKEQNSIPRYGAIGIGGLAGLVLALRRGKFKKLLYTTTGATAMAALCYPKEAEQYTGEGLKLAKQYIVIVYHFINGVFGGVTAVLSWPTRQSRGVKSLSGLMVLGSRRRSPVRSSRYGHHHQTKVLRDYAGAQLPPLPKPLLSNSTSGDSLSGNKAAELLSSTLLPSPPTVTTSNIQLGQIPMPPIDVPSNVTDADQKQAHSKREEHVSRAPVLSSRRLKMRARVLSKHVPNKKKSITTVG